MKAVIDFYVFCFERYLSIEVDETLKEEAEHIMNTAYDEWIEGDDCSCCEEYILQQLTNAGIEYELIED